MLLPTSMPQSCASAIRLVSGGAVDLVRRIDQQQQLALLVEVLLERIDLRREEVDLRPAMTTTDASSGTGTGLREHDLLDRVVLAAERARRSRCSRRALRSVLVLLAVALREVHLPLLAADHLDDRVGDVLFAVRRDPLGSSLVVDDDGAVLLDLVLLGDRRLLGGIDVVGADLLRRVLVFAAACRGSAGSRAPRRTPSSAAARRASAMTLLRLIRQAELLVRRSGPSACSDAPRCS